MSITTQTTLYREVDKETEQLALTLECLGCQRFRTFQIHRNIELLLNTVDNYAALQIKSVCESCQMPIAVTLGWQKDRSGYSWHRVPMDLNMTFTVTDDMPMKGQEDE